MDLGLRIHVVDSDDAFDEIELRIRVDNGRFAATTDVCADGGACRRLADAIRGFPSSFADRRDVTIGAPTQDPEVVRNAAVLCFHVGPSGGARVEVMIQEMPCDATRFERAEFVLAIEAASVDRFVASLEAMTSEVGSEASLSRAS